jgi:hypothetical protein
MLMAGGGAKVTFWIGGGEVLLVMLVTLLGGGGLVVLVMLVTLLGGGG